MKVGDRVIVSYADGDQFFGDIYGETAKSWKIEFDNGDSRTVRKTTKIELVVDETPELVKVTAEEFVEAAEEGVGPVEVPSYIPTYYTPSKRLKRRNIAILLFILAAAGVTAYLIVRGIGLF